MRQSGQLFQAMLAHRVRHDGLDGARHAGSVMVFRTTGFHGREFAVAVPPRLSRLCAMLLPSASDAACEARRVFCRSALQFAAAGTKLKMRGAEASSLAMTKGQLWEWR